MKKKNLAGGLSTLLGREETPAPHEETTSRTEELRNTIKDEKLKEALQDREQLKARLRSKRYAGGRPKKGEVRESKTLGYGRTCIVIHEAKMDKIREIALRENFTIKEVFEAMMDNLITNYEAKHGEITPTDHSVDVTKLFK